jgi:hypothetical protein
MFSCQNCVCIAVLCTVYCMPHHYNLIDLMIVVMYGEEYKSWRFSLCSFLRSLIGLSVLHALLFNWPIFFFFLFQNNIKNGIYPAPLQSLWAIVAILAAMHFAKYGMVHTCINAILVLMPGYVFARPACPATCSFHNQTQFCNSEFTFEV